MAKKASKILTPLRLEGALDIQNAVTLHAILRERMSLGTPVFTLDLGGITACDTAGLQLLSAARQSLLQTGRAWQPKNPSEAVLRACSEVAIKPEELGL